MPDIFPVRPHLPVGPRPVNLLPLKDRLVQPPFGTLQPHRPITLLIDAIRAAGAGENCVLVLDALDPRSFLPGDPRWKDLSGEVRPDATNQSPAGFFLGTADTPQTTDPTWNPRGYWEFDGTQFFTYAASNTTWMNNMHKNDTSFSYIDAAKVTTANFTHMSTRTGSATIGMTCGPNVYESDNGSGADGHEISETPTNAFAAQIQRPNKWSIGGFSMTEVSQTTSFFWLNGKQDPAGLENWASASTPSASNATFTMHLCSDGGAGSPAPIGIQLGFVAVWDTQLTKTQIDKVWQATRGRYEI